MTAPADTGSTYALLSDGRTVEIRVPTDADLAGVVELHRRMSPEEETGGGVPNVATCPRPSESGLFTTPA